MLNVKIDEFKKILENKSIDEIKNLLSEQKNDNRKGIQNIIKIYEKKILNYNKELKRIDNMLFYERKYYEQGFEYIGGVDEVGRGPLAGPIIACTVILPKNTKIMYANDSKKLSEIMREKLYDEIMEKALSVSFGIISPLEIDEINIRQATIKAMEESILESKHKIDCILIDGIESLNINMKKETIIKGDEKSISISCASIIAKVTRDNIMKEYSKLYPEYGFDKNKGYGSKNHIDMIEKIGLCPIHRKSFLKKFL